MKSATSMSLRDRLLSKIVVDSDGCWLWQDTLSAKGYGKIKFKQVTMSAHRASYEVFVGAIPEDFDIDHVCHSKNPNACVGSMPCKHRSCINPEHLESVSRQVHGGRSLHKVKNHCVNGHLRTSKNIYVHQGKQHCLDCRRGIK